MCLKKDGYNEWGGWDGSYEDGVVWGVTTIYGEVEDVRHDGMMRVKVGTSGEGPDVVVVNTSNHACLSIKRSYNWHFEYDKKHI